MAPVRPAEDVMPKPLLLTTVGISSVKKIKMEQKPQVMPIFPTRASTCKMTEFSATET